MPGILCAYNTPIVQSGVLATKRHNTKINALTRRYTFNWLYYIGFNLHLPFIIYLMLQVLSAESLDFLMTL